MEENHNNIETESIKLMRGQKGTYAWEIKVRDASIGKETIDRLEGIDAELRMRFIQTREGPKWQKEER